MFGQLLRDGKLQVMTGHAFVIGDGFNVEQQAVLGIVLVHVDAAGTRAVSRAARVVGRNRIGRAVGLHRNHDQLVLGQAAEQLRQLGVHLVGVVLIEVENLLARCAVQFGVLANVVVEALQVAKPCCFAMTSICGSISATCFRPIW